MTRDLVTHDDVPMRIGIDLSPMAHSGRRGVGAYARSLLSALERVGPEHHFTLFLPGMPDSDPYPPRHSRYAMPALPFGRASALVSNQVMLPPIARRLNLDVLHVLYVPYNPSHALAPVWKSVPQVITLHDLTPLNAPVMLRKWRYRLFYRLALWQCKRANALIVDSEESKHDALRARIAPARRIFVAPLAVPDESVETPAKGAAGFRVPGQPYILHVGSDDWNKNREGVLRAYALLVEHDNLGLALVGGSASSLAALAEPVRARVTHYPWLDSAALRALYAGAAVFVFPSFYEGFGLPILEAMAAGVPVVTSDRGAMKEVAGEAALLANPEQPDEIAGAIRRIVEDKDLASQLQTRGAARAAEFTWEKTAQETLAAYRYAARSAAHHEFRTPNDYKGDDGK